MNRVPFTLQFKLKSLNATGTEFLENVRCCLRWDTQIENVDFNPEILYAHVASHAGIRMLLSVAAAQNDEVEGGDVDIAYLYGNIDIDIYTQQPTESSRKEAKRGFVCKLLKSIYGAMQAGGIWVSVLDRRLHRWSLESSSFHSRIDLYRQGTEYIMLAVFVDHLPFASNSTRLMKTLKENLKASFKVKLFCKLLSFIGWNINITSTEIKIYQRGYAKSLISE